MAIHVGKIAALYRYPVKSLGGEPLERAELGWHGLDGDRRFAFRRLDDGTGFPWLTASKLPEMILFSPERRESTAAEDAPTHVRTPDGAKLALFGEELAEEIGRRHGSPVEMMHLNRGIFDEASVSLIASATVDEVGKLAGHPPDVRRFRPNVVISLERSVPFSEDDWVGGALSFGDTEEAAVIGITNHDERCAMVNFDPDSARAAPEVMKAIVRERDNKAGVYGTVMRRGRLALGQPIFFEPATAQRERV